MDPNILNKLIELYEGGSWITTNQLIRELGQFGKPTQIVDELISQKIIERLIDEKIDICSFRTTKFTRILKLKNLSD